MLLTSEARIQWINHLKRRATVGDRTIHQENWSVPAMLALHAFAHQGSDGVPSFERVTSPSAPTVPTSFATVILQ